MTLTEFLSTANADDVIALSEAQSHTEPHLNLIPCETVNAFLAQTELRIPLKKLAADESSPFQNAADTFIDSTRTGRPFNFTVGTAAGDEQMGMLDIMIGANITVEINGASVNITSNLESFKAKANLIANKEFHPFENVTLEQVKAIRNPATWQPVAMAAEQVVTPEGDLISNSDRAGFRFKLTPAENFTGRVDIRMYAKGYNDTDFTLQASYPITVSSNWTASQVESHVFKRAAGLAGMRHFKFEYKAPYAGAMSGVSVEGIA